MHGAQAVCEMEGEQALGTACHVLLTETACQEKHTAPGRAINASYITNCSGLVMRLQVMLRGKLL